MTHKIVGAAGSGKTYYLLSILKVIKEIVAFISFTKAAIAEAKGRVKNTDTGYFRTLHSLCYKLLGVRQGQMIDFSLMQAFQKRMGNVGYEVSFFFDEDNYQEKKSIPLYINQLATNLMLPVEEVYKMENYDVSLKDVKYVISCYNDFKKFHNVIDFNDLLLKALDLENIEVPETVFLDEAQDLTVLQWAVFDHIFKNAKNKYIVGDDCQCLYHWAGVDIDKFINLKYDEIILLDKSYRVPEKILKASNKIYKKINRKIEREIHSTTEGGIIKAANKLEYFDFNTTDTYFILIRNWYLKNDIVRLLNEKGIPYTLKDSHSVNKRDIKAIYNYERARAGKEEPDKNLLQSYCSKLDKSKPWFEAFHYLDSDKMIYYREVLRNGFNLSHNKIELTTIHRAKGREADHVVLFQDVSQKVFDNRNKDSEHKVFYVAVTRARKSLTVVRPDTNKYYEVL